MKVNIDEFRKNLERLIDPYEIPGAMQAFVEAAEDTGINDFLVDPETKWIPWTKCKWIKKEDHDDTQISGE